MLRASLNLAALPLSLQSLLLTCDGTTLKLKGELTQFSEPMKQIILEYIVFHFPNLETLLLSDNYLTELTEAIGHLSRLKKLNVSSNKLTRLPASLQQCSQLISLNLRRNPLEEMPESTQLKILTLSFYPGKNRPLGFNHFIKGLSQLEQLTLYSSRLGHLPKSLMKLSQLTSLNLFDNELTILPKSIEHFSQLKTLDLSDNKLTKLPSTIGTLDQLNTLDLTTNEITKLPRSLGDLPQLTILNVSQNRLAKLPKSIGQLAQLKELDLSQNQLAKLPKSFRNLSQLITLNLYENHLTKLPSTIGNFVQLKLLNFGNNPLTILPITLSYLSEKLNPIGYSNQTENSLTFPPPEVVNKGFKEGIKPFLKEAFHLPEVHYAAHLLKLTQLSKFLYKLIKGRNSSTTPTTSPASATLTLEVLPKDIIHLICLHTAENLSLSQGSKAMQALSSMKTPSTLSLILERFLEKAAPQWREAVKQRYETSHSQARS